MKLLWGVDEAGRGPILGPMAIAVVGVTPAGTRALKRLGVDDSKRFGSGPEAVLVRRELASRIRGVVGHFRVQLVDVDEIDHHVFQGQLNALERKVAAQLLTRAKADRDATIICDGAKLFAPLRARFPRLRAVDKGESAHVSVAAASILAKDARDAAFAEIARRYASEFGELRGGGYLNAATRRFLNDYAARHGGLPPEARRSWGADKQANLSLF
jgi:ribonuclease HII